MFQSFQLFCLAFVVMLTAACNDQVSQQQPQADTTVIEVPTGMRVVPGFGKADSVQILYYNDPFGADSVRYYRYFTYLALNDTAVLGTIRRALEQPITGTVQKSSCRSEGKMYLLHRDAIIKTVYFNFQPGNCNHLYFIADGNFYYLPVAEELRLKLQQLKASAAAPPSGVTAGE